MKLKLMVSSISSCSGCISTLLTLDIFPQFFERTEIEYFPFISDNLELNDCDIALIEGSVIEQQQIKYLKEIRKCAKKLYALGTCAAFGGIVNLSNKKNSRPISDFVEIDGMIPGCPPPPVLLGNSMIRLIENKKIILEEKNLCSTCPLRSTLKISDFPEIESLMPKNSDIDFPEGNLPCFLTKGILCMGPITRSGCESSCINQGVPCEGCMGPVSKQFTSNLVNFLSLFKVKQNLKNYKGIFYRFSKPRIKR
jgi:F420-non-reducing hydrogenase small subunit